MPFANTEVIDCDPSKYEEAFKEIMISDRDNVEKSKKAFVTYIRSYMEHDVRKLAAG